MDANRNIIPMVEDDQGEGVKDPLTIDDIIQLENNPFFLESRADMFKRLIDNEFKKNQPEARWAPPRDFNRRR